VGGSGNYNFKCDNIFVLEGSDEELENRLKLATVRNSYFDARIFISFF